MTNLTSFGLVVLSCLMAEAASANVLGLFPAGAGCKSAAMETAIDCSEPQTLLYNPAGLSALGDGTNVEVGFARLQYSYEHPSYDPVQLKIMTPLATGGWKGSFLNSQATYGFAVMPASATQLNVNGLPRRIDKAQPESLNVQAKRDLLHIPLGGSYHVADTGLNFGGAIIYTYDRRTLKGAAVTEPTTKLVDVKATGHFFRPIIGSIWHLENSESGVSYLFPLAKHFKGQTFLATERESFRTKLVDYDPAVLLFSMRTKIADYTLTGNLNHIFGAKGRGVQRDPIERKVSNADLNDSNHLGVRLAYSHHELGEVTIAAAYLNSYWEDGYYYTDSDGISHHEQGHLFGQFNAIPVRNQSITWKKSFAAVQTHVALFRSAGSTTVGSHGDNPGFYQIEFISSSCGLNYIF